MLQEILRDEVLGDVCYCFLDDTNSDVCVKTCIDQGKKLMVVIIEADKNSRLYSLKKLLETSELPVLIIAE